MEDSHQHMKREVSGYDNGQTIGLPTMGNPRQGHHGHNGTYNNRTDSVARLL